MKRFPSFRLGVLFACGLIISISGCGEPEGPAEKAGKTVDQAMEKTADSLQETMHSTGKAINDASEKTGQAVKDAVMAQKK